MVIEMKKAEFLKRYGEEAYKKRLGQIRVWREAHSEKIEEHNHELSRKSGKRYEKKLEYNRTGLCGERNKVRSKHRKEYYPFKQIIAPDSQLHHSWRPESPDYDGVALVEKDQHMHGIIEVIQILEGEITLFSEREIREQ